MLNLFATSAQSQPRARTCIDEPFGSSSFFTTNDDENKLGSSLDANALVDVEASKSCNLSSFNLDLIDIDEFCD